MKVFIRDCKINFVDSNNVFVGFDNEQCQRCCEDFGWQLSRTLPDFRTLDYEEIGIKDGIDPDGFQFDIHYFKEHEVNDSYQDKINAIAAFRLTKEDEEIFLTLFNHHNGYYTHGFEMKCLDVVLFSGNL